MVRHATPILTPSFLMHGPTALSKKTTSEQESRHISTRIETVSAIGHVDHRFDEYFGQRCWSIAAFPDPSHGEDPVSNRPN